MSTMARQQALLVAEAWQNLYANQTYVDFQSYSQDNLVNAILNYVKVNYPDSFNDWTTNSEFVIKVRTLAWLHQNLSYRIDLDIRENFIQTATRRDAILMLAENVFYHPNRVTGASGELRISSITTTQPLVDSNSTSLTNIEIFWNDQANADWFEQFTLVMNNALTPRTQFGHPLTRFNEPPTRLDLYMFNARAPSSGVFPFTANVAGTGLPFGWINVSLDKDTGVVRELAPNPSNALRVLYRTDGRGSGSAGTGFFLPIRQGTLSSIDKAFSIPEAMQQVILGTSNIDNGDIFVQQLDTAGNVLVDWTEVGSLFGQNVSFNTLSSDLQTIYETHTLLNDKVRVQFGDGKFGTIPTDRFRFWFRTVNPIALVVNPSDIQKQSFVVPYVSDNALFFLTIRASLVAPITNALPTDSNDAIRDAVGASFAAQNRMVTAADYNLFPKSDPSILKVKTVNRTYSGHSAYAKIYDPTGLYNGIKVLGEDGRLYRDSDAKSQFVSGLTSEVTLDQLVLQYILPLIQSPDKSSLYYTEYSEYLCVGNPTWVNTSTVSGISKGNFKKSAAIIPVGDTATDEFFYLIPGTQVRYTDLSGPLITAQRITSDGTGIDGITLAGLLPDDTVIFSLFPPLRNQFDAAEQTAIKTNLFNLQDFGISWNQDAQTWDMIANANLNKTGAFSLVYQGDTSNTQKDASWMIWLKYIPNSGDGPEWKITDRGTGIFFESSREIKFVYINNGPLVNPDTGKLVRDNVNVLGINEARDSLHRLGLSNFLAGNCGSLIYDFTADGVETCFTIRQRVTSEHLVVLADEQLMLFGIDYDITPGPIGDSICFFVAPLLGTIISIRINDEYVYFTQTLVDSMADGSIVFYPIIAAPVNDNNSRLIFDGVLQNPNDFLVNVESGVSGFYVTPALYPGTVVYGYGESGPTSDVFKYSLYDGDGSTVLFDTNCEDQTIHTVIVSIDGIMQSAGLDYTIDNITSAPESLVSFITAPGLNTTVSIIAAPFPLLVRSFMYTAVANGVVSQFAIPFFTNVTDPQVMVALNGVIQRDPDYIITPTGITFAVAPLDNMRVDVFVLYGALGLDCSPNDNSCYVRYLVDDYIFDAVGIETTPDGYTDIDGIEVAPVDSNHDGEFDDPFEFNDILIPDGLTDLVLWRSVIEAGFSVWNPVDTTTVPKATYGFQSHTSISAGSEYDQTKYEAGDIHLDQTTDQYLLADAASGNWIVAPIQTHYKSAIGRSALKFIWTHYPADNTRIDPAVSNIMDMYILTVAYDIAYRAWITSGFDGDEPTAPTSESLQNQYDYFNDTRMTDDSLIFHPIHYKPLFGRVAELDLQATFLAIKPVGSNLSDNDLILRIINAIELFFAAANWDLGESFFFTDLVAFVHRAVAPNLTSLVVVAKDGGPFGELFQVRCAPDELFVSAAQPSDIMIVSSFTNDNLQISNLTGQ